MARVRAENADGIDHCVAQRSRIFGALDGDPPGGHAKSRVLGLDAFEHARIEIIGTNEQKIEGEKKKKKKIT